MGFPPIKIKREAASLSGCRLNHCVQQQGAEATSGPLPLKPISLCHQAACGAQQGKVWAAAGGERQQAGTRWWSSNSQSENPVQNAKERPRQAIKAQLIPQRGTSGREPVTLTLLILNDISAASMPPRDTKPSPCLSKPRLPAQAR